MSRGLKGSMTITLALMAMTFLTLCLVLTEGVRIYYLRVKAAQALELSEFSVLSEYQKELWEHYGLFFLDLCYEQEEERQDILNGRMLLYLEKNIPELQENCLRIYGFRRATDKEGAPFAAQAVEHMKKRSGADLLEGMLKEDQTMENNTDLEEILAEDQKTAEELLAEMVDEEGKPLFTLALPEVSFPSVESLSTAVFGDTAFLSQKEIKLEERICWRSLKKGDGAVSSLSLLDMQFFYSYLMRYLNDYIEDDPHIWKENLEYQIEYVIAGKENDRENLENIMWRIFLLRAVGDYLFFHQDAGRIAQVQAQAAAIAGVTGNAALISVVQEVLLIAQAIDQGVEETRKLFNGEKVPLYENGISAGLEIGYEEYLWLFLNLTKSSECICRAMDVIELEIRSHAGCSDFGLDHCVDAFEVEWSYEYQGIFSGREAYRAAILRKMQYEI